MNLNIVNRDASSFNEAVGISDERADELSAAMDTIAGKYIGKVTRTCDIFSEIVALCNDTEEVVYCTVNHCNWVAGKVWCYLLSFEKENFKTMNTLFPRQGIVTQEIIDTADVLDPQKCIGALTLKASLKGSISEEDLNNFSWGVCNGRVVTQFEIFIYMLKKRKFRRTI